MRTSVVGFFMIMVTIFLSGCGQDGMATLDNRGSNFYGRGGVVASNSYGSQATLQAVPVDSISTSNLSAPTQTAQAQPQATAQAMPFQRAANWQWPVNGRITERFGQQADGAKNEGIVIAASEGTPIRAAQAGEVAYVGTDTKNYGNIVILRHADGVMTSYAHARNIIVKQGDKVPGGSVIAYVGQSGNAKVPELHFAVRDGRSSIDPLMKLPSQPQQMASN